LLAIGLFTRIAAAAIAIQMFYIVFFINWANGFFWTPKAGIEYPLLWGIVTLAFFVMGGGRYSVDRSIGKEF
jgi:putative oxidoreductase